MIIAEIKVSDETEWEVRLFNSSLTAFRNMANYRFVAVGRVMEISTEEIIKVVKNNLGW